MIGQLHYPVVLPPGVIHWYSLNSRPGGLQTRTARFGEEGSILPVPGNEPRIVASSRPRTRHCTDCDIPARNLPTEPYKRVGLSVLIAIRNANMYVNILQTSSFLGNAVGQLGAALRYKAEGYGFDSSWCHWKFSLIKPSYRTMAQGTTRPLTEICTRNISWG
jgi:hypothetical protein